MRHLCWLLSVNHGDTLGPLLDRRDRLEVHSLLSTSKVSMELYSSGIPQIIPGELFGMMLSAADLVEETWCSCRGLSLAIGIFRQPSTCFLPRLFVNYTQQLASCHHVPLSHHVCRFTHSPSIPSPPLKRAMRRLSPTRHIPGLKPGVSNQSAYRTTGFNFSKVTELGNCFADET